MSFSTASVIIGRSTKPGHSSGQVWFVRGKKRVKEMLAWYLQQQYAATLLPSGQYQLRVPYRTDDELDSTMEELLKYIAFEADLRHCSPDPTPCWGDRTADALTR